MRLSTENRPPGRLGLFDVYVLSTGAMISAGFFLLPGLAAARAGPAVALAYLLAGAMIVPALLSEAELATAMPKASGTHDLLDRTLGPMVGTIGGVATWLTLLLKSGFALIGIGAYLGLVINLPIQPVAIGLALAIGLTGLIGTRGHWRPMRWLVPAVLAVVVLFVASGLAHMSGSAVVGRRFEPLLTEGLTGILATAGLVFVSYVGLTNVAGRTELLERPARDLPLGMGLALITVTTLYVLGVYVMLAVLGVDALSATLTPVAAAGAAVTAWLPAGTGRWLMVGAAIASFTAVAGAGIRAASQYPIALAKDRLLPDTFSLLAGRHGQLVSTAMTLLILATLILALDVVTVAKLAGALQLLLFGLINVAVIVMRESRVDSGTHHFRSPLYPWLQLLGIFVSLVLVAEMGWMPVLFTAAVTAASFGWYNYYGRERATTDGSIAHAIERLGRRRIMGMDRELRELLKERVSPARDAVVEESFDDVVDRALVIDRPESAPLSRFITDASALLAPRISTPADRLRNLLIAGLVGAPVARGAALLHARVPDIVGSELLIARCAGGVRFDVKGLELTGAPDAPVHALFFLVSDEKATGRHLRILAKLAGRVEDSGFMDLWLGSAHEQDLKATLRPQ